MNQCWRWDHRFRPQRTRDCRWRRSSWKRLNGFRVRLQGQGFLTCRKPQVGWRCCSRSSRSTHLAFAQRQTGTGTPAGSMWLGEPAGSGRGSRRSGAQERDHPASRRERVRFSTNGGLTRLWGPGSEASRGRILILGRNSSTTSSGMDRESRLLRLLRDRQRSFDEGEFVVRGSQLSCFHRDGIFARRRF